MALWEATHRSALSQLLDRLGSAGIETVLMKGTAIAYALYPDPAARRRGDSDLLVQPSDLERVRTILAACGWYRNDDPHGLTHQEGWLFDAGGAFIHALDLHWESSDRSALQEILTREDLFASREPLTALAPFAFRAEIPLTIIHEAMNQAWHQARGYWTEQGRIKGSRRLIWSVDFALMTQSLDDAGWKRLVDLCATRGIGPLVSRTLQSAAVDLCTPLPEQALQMLATQPEDKSITAYFEASDDLDEFLLKLRHASGWGQRLQMIRERGFPPAHHLRTKYPKQANWPTPLLQVRLLFETAGRVVRKVASR